MSIFSLQNNRFNGTEIIYSLQDFISQKNEEFHIKPCPLCGKIHSLQIHSYPKRGMRDPRTGENAWIKIIAMICKRAKKLGEKYTKRLLPDFLLPYRVIRSDKTLEAQHEDPGELEKVCSILGCIDLRTAKKYLEYGKKAIKKASLAIAERLSHFSSKLFTTGFHPEEDYLSCFESLVARYNVLQIHLYGGMGIPYNPSYFIGINWNSVHQHKSMTYVSNNEPAPDTS